MFDDRIHTGPSAGPLVIGHRGASADFPENTASAFRGAAEQGADWVELDVRINRAGELVIHHNPDFHDGRSVWSTTLAEAPEGTIDLEQALNSCAPMGINVEIKNSPGDLSDAPYGLEVVDLVLDLLARRREAGILEQILVSSFDLPTIDRVRDLAPGLATGYLVLDPSSVDAVAVAAGNGHTALHPWDPFVTEDLMEQCRAAGLLCNTWTVDLPDRVAALAALGVDGIVTNTPASACGALGRS
jgi:glycerophosphoryl diester phosphodiesterase